MIVREATEADAPAVSVVMQATYGSYYPYPQFYDVTRLRRIILGEDTLVLVAEEPKTGRIVGTASVILEVGAYSDLLGEFGRLAVLPIARGKGIGGELLRERLRIVRDRLHVGIMEARVARDFSQRNAQKHGFVPLGFLPLKNLFRERESVAVMGRWFGDALSLRRNNPRIIPEVLPIASLVSELTGRPVDAIVDDSAPPYPHDHDFTLEALTTNAYTSLLHIERGRTQHREVYGPMRLHYGFFKLRTEHADYLVARTGSRVAGALGYIVDDHEHFARIFELISPDDQAIDFLLSTLERRCREAGDVAYIEIDVRADAPRLQRTLLEIGFVPAAYIPAMVFQDVERLDVLRMVRVLVPLDLGEMDLTPEVQRHADLVLGPLREQQALPQITDAVRRSGLFQGLADEQIARLSGICDIQRFEPGVPLIREGGERDTLFLVLSGAAEVLVADHAVGSVGAGEVLGERRLLTASPHTATAIAQTCVETAAFPDHELTALIRRRPDIGVVIYRNLAHGLGEKLRRVDEATNSIPRNPR